MSTILIPGFNASDTRGRVWTTDFRFGLQRQPDGRLILLDALEMPTARALDDRSAALVLKNVTSRTSVDLVRRAWDAVASQV